MSIRRMGNVALSALLLGLMAGVGWNAIRGGNPADSAELAVSNGSRQTAQKPPRQGPFAVVLVVDAARFDEVRSAKMPNLARLIAGGTQYSRAWVGQLPSITETSHATIGTGVLPARHLILGDTWRVPGKSQMAPNLLSSQLDRTGYIGSFIRRTGVPTLAGAVHQRFPGSLVASLSGHKIYAADAMGAGSADFVAFGSLNSRGHYVPSAIPGHMPAQSILSSPQLDLPSYPRKAGVEDGWTTTLAEKFLFKYHPRLLMINLPEVDTVGHVAGTNASIMEPLLSQVDRQIGRLVAAYGRAGMLSQTYWIITSDHAMIPATHTIQQDRIKAIIDKARGRGLYVGHGDYSSIWLKNLGSVPRVAVELANANIPNVAAVYVRTSGGGYTLVSSPARLAEPSANDAYLHLLSTIASGEAPDVVLLYDENTITMTPSFMKANRLGDHGGATWGAQHIPLVLAGPGIKQAYVSSYPARLVDLAPTLEVLFGAKPQHQDGVALADAMVHPPSWATIAQSQTSGQLSPDVSALEREAKLRPNNTLR